MAQSWVCGIEGGIMCVCVCNTNVQDRSVTVVAAWREQVVVVLLTVRRSVPLKEVPGTDLLLTVGTHKVLRVPRAPHGGHHLGTREGTRQTHHKSKLGAST